MVKLNSPASFLFVLCLYAISCAQSHSVSVSRVTVEGIASSEKAFLMPTDSTHSVYSKLNYPEVIYRFYNARSFVPAWLNDRTETIADSLFLFLKSVRLYGLLPQNYHADELKRVQHTSEADSMYRKEALLTDAFLSLVRDLRYGRSSSIPGPLEDSMSLRAFENALTCKEIKKVLEAQEPSNNQYLGLKKSLFAILSKADSSDLNLLYAGQTLDSIEVHKKVQRIEINMERWRCEAADISQRYIWINIPSFQLQVIDNGQPILESRVIVGKPDSQTPVLSSSIECITLYPYWYIPRKIAIEEYLPIIQNDTSFLTRNNFDVLDRKGNILSQDSLDWQMFTSKYFPVILRQREGPENSLGVIKFVFDNPYAVFLHDTNMKNLFKKESRMFSHGCIRMEKALELARYLTADSERIDSKLLLKKRYTINLKNPIPIYTRYLTCESVSGELKFYDDVYGLDKSLIGFLYGRNSSGHD